VGLCGLARSVGRGRRGARSGGWPMFDSCDVI